MKRYSIGNFAYKAGVTPDFLKYYEKHGLLRPKMNEFGYRYYDATSTSYINECIKLKNWGFSAKEIEILLKSTDYQQMVTLLEKRQSKIEKQICFLQGLLANSRKMSDSLPFYGSLSPWNIGVQDGFYYLSQCFCLTFYTDKERYDILKEWLRWMPLACSTVRVDNRSQESIIEWGVSVPEVFARQQGLPLNAPVEYIPAARYLEYFDRRLLADDQNYDCLDEVRRSMFTNVQQVIDRYQLRVTGPSYFMVQAKLREEGNRYTYQKIYVPIE